MKTRLLVFAATLLLLPLAGFLLGGREWDELSRPQVQDRSTATALTLMILLGYTILVDLLVRLRTGNRPLVTQRGYFLAVGAGGAAMCWLLAYLNGFAASWPSLQEDTLGQIALDTLLFALLAPAVLCTRALLGTFPGLLGRLAHGPSLRFPNGGTTALTLAAVAAFGLLGGAALPAQLSWLLWLAPLLLLLSLQLLWHEGTIFDVLREGDWGRLVCAALSGLIVGNLAALGELIAEGAPLALLNGGYALFGLLCLQLGDVVAENWRGKTHARPSIKKPFPIPVVVKK